MSFCFLSLQAQEPELVPLNKNKNINKGNISKGIKTANDTTGFQQRDDLKDSITIYYHFLDSSGRNYLDSSVNDFDTYYPLPTSWNNLGNNGAAAYPLIFKPNLKPGFDAGFHAYDIYKFTLEATKLYRTTRPFSMIGYQLAKGKEQMLQASHTQNPKPNFNFGFDYRLISSPGLFINQNTNHNNYRLFAAYQGKRKRYNGTFIIVGNTIRAAQNGGIQNDTLLEDPNRKDRFSVPVNLGNEGRYQNNPFVTTVNTGVTYKDFTFFLRQSYDLGKRDSFAINDSTTEFLFYPKLRIQHTIKISNNNYSYLDIRADSTIYKNWYNIDFPKAIDTFSLNENWNTISNDLSLVQFPDTKNSSQFFLAGVTFENIRSNISNTGDFNNLMVHAEYRNKTRNKLWDVLINGEFYLTGFNNGDYFANAKLNRYLNKKLGYVNLFFTNVNRSPSFLFDGRSPFNLSGETITKKENTISFGATSNNSFISLGIRNHFLNNYTYFTGYYNFEQYSKPINILQAWASKKIKLTKNINWYADVNFQQSAKNSPVNIPLFYSRNRIAFEGNYFKNLFLSTGVELRYYSPYRMNNYSPINGQFTVQDTATISNRPDITLFLNFRIKSFTAYIRGENLNTLNTTNGFDFTHNNFSAPLYPTPGFMIRFGIKWWFVN